jgi:hypothetical protein
MRFAVGVLVATGGLVAVLVGALTMVYAGDVADGDPAVGTGIAIAAGGLAAMAAGIWILRGSARR